MIINIIKCIGVFLYIFLNVASIVTNSTEWVIKYKLFDVIYKLFGYNLYESAIEIMPRKL